MTWRPRVSEIIGRFARASNATLLAETVEGELVVYKPLRGEAPLWDFPSETLAAREVLTYQVDRVLEFQLVPETVIADGPFGPGAVQRYIEPDPDFDPVPLLDGPAPSLWPVAILDVVCNNADRKAGHLLRGAQSGRLFAIDHGLTFHPQPKLRTVLWNFAGRPIPDEFTTALGRISGALAGSLGDLIERHLGSDSRAATQSNVEMLIARPIHPLPPTDRPAVPWPPV